VTPIAAASTRDRRTRRDDHPARPRVPAARPRAPSESSATILQRAFVRHASIVRCPHARVSPGEDDQGHAEPASWPTGARSARPARRGRRARPARRAGRAHHRDAVGALCRRETVAIVITVRRALERCSTVRFCLRVE
jgi:hypothetical protein